MRIVIDTIDAAQHRYETLGDYWWPSPDDLFVKVSRMSGEHAVARRHEFLVAIHEIVEALLCEEHGIAEPDIKAFDEAHLDADEPGNLPDAPYHREHVFAECVERLVARELGVNWQEYEAACEAMFT